MMILKILFLIQALCIAHISARPQQGLNNLGQDAGVNYQNDGQLAPIVPTIAPIPTSQVIARVPASAEASAAASAAAGHPVKVVKVIKKVIIPNAGTAAAAPANQANLATNDVSAAQNANTATTAGANSLEPSLTRASTPSGVPSVDNGDVAALPSTAASGEASLGAVGAVNAAGPTGNGLVDKPIVDSMAGAAGSTGAAGAAGAADAAGAAGATNPVPIANPAVVGSIGNNLNTAPAAVVSNPAGAVASNKVDPNTGAKTAIASNTASASNNPTIATNLNATPRPAGDAISGATSPMLANNPAIPRGKLANSKVAAVIGPNTTAAPVASTAISVQSSKSDDNSRGKLSDKLYNCSINER